MILRFALATLSTAGLIAACGHDEEPGPPVNSACGTTPAPQKPAATCPVTIALPPVITPAKWHVPEGTQITYCSNPPVGGAHYPIWAAFKEYSAPIDWPYLVHDEEHGAVLLLYKCDGACPDIVEGLRGVRDRAASDPTCAPGEKRIIIMPSPTIPSKVAAAAWGAVYTADCLDPATLDAFVRDHYRKGPEDLCAAGKSF